MASEVVASCARCSQLQAELAESNQLIADLQLKLDKERKQTERLAADLQEVSITLEKTITTSAKASIARAQLEKTQIKQDKEL